MSDSDIAGRLTRRALLGAMMGGVAGAAFANAPMRSVRPLARLPGFEKRAEPRPEALIAAARLEGKVGFAVADAQSGEVLEVHNPLAPLPPASVTKAITALYALDALGPGYRFRTRLIGTGPLRGGRLEGDLVLVGGGDPTLDSDALGDMARQLKEAGVTEVAGGFRVDAAALPAIWSIDPEQPDHLGYNPAISGLNLNYNRVHFEWKRGSNGYAVSLDARARRYSPEVAIAQMRVVDRDVPVYTYADAGGADQWTVARRALGDGGSRWLPVRKPDLYAAEVFQTLARSHGIRLPRAEPMQGPASGTILVDRVSADLQEILADMLRYSTNLTAEVVGLTATARASGGAASLGASAEAMTAWMRRRFDARRARFEDHSGLGDDSRMSASDMVRALVAVGPGGVLAPILKPIPIRGGDGSVIEAHPVKVRAKTGTLNFVSALAGYMTAEDGRALAFAIFTGDTERRDRLKRSDREIPEGARAWTARSRRLQQQLIQRWGVVHTA